MTAAFGGLCEPDEAVLAIYDHGVVKPFFRYANLETNSDETKKEAEPVFHEFVRNPYDVEVARELVEILRFDSDFKKAKIKLEKPKVLYSKLSLYEKSKYSLEQLEKLREAEERYNFEKKKILEIVKNTRTINPLNNDEIERSFFWTLLFNASDKEIVDWIESVRAENGWILRPKDRLLTEALDAALGKFDDYRKKRIFEAEKEVLFKKFDPRSFSFFVLYSAAAGLSLPELPKSQSDRDRLKAYFYDLLPNLCEFDGMRQPPKFSSERVIGAALLSFYFPEETEKINRLLSIDYKRGKSLFEFVRIYVAARCGLDGVVGADELASFIPGDASFLERLFGDFVVKTLTSELNNGDPFLVYRISSGILESGRGKVSFEFSSNLKRLAVKAAKRIRSEFTDKRYLLGALGMYDSAKKISEERFSKEEE
jgi:hypothetical protein